MFAGRNPLFVVGQQPLNRHAVDPGDNKVMARESPCFPNRADCAGNCVLRADCNLTVESLPGGFHLIDNISSNLVDDVLLGGGQGLARFSNEFRIATDSDQLPLRQGESISVSPGNFDLKFCLDHPRIVVDRLRLNRF